MQASARSSVGELPIASAKGSNFIGLIKAVDKLYGDGAGKRVLAALPEEVGQSMREGHVLAVGWYSVAWYAEVHATIDRVLNTGAAGARGLGHEATTSDFSGMHRLLASMLSVETVFGQTHRLMGLYWKGGRIERLELKAGLARLRFADWQGFTRLVWEDILGSCEAVLHFAGARTIRCRTIGVPNTQHSVEFELRWT